MERRRHIVVLSGAGISAESGLPVFRGAGGLWEGYNVMDVASPEAWELDPEAVLNFYNYRRKLVREAEPNAAHLALAGLESAFDVSIITQNIDDLHERAGSSSVLHLHGEILKARSTLDPDIVYDLADKDIELGDRCEKGSQLRPHVVWFGETVGEIGQAAEIAARAELFLVVGTSLSVHPAAGLVQLVPYEARVFVINPEQSEAGFRGRVKQIRKTACAALPELSRQLMEEASSQAK